MPVDRTYVGIDRLLGVSVLAGRVDASIYLRTGLIRCKLTRPIV
jgi:hypothetical protein